MQIVRFSVVKKDMQAVLAGFITDFSVDTWRVHGHFFLGQTLILMDAYDYRHPQYPVNHVFGKAVVTKMVLGISEFDKTHVYFEVIEVYTPL